MRFVNRKTGIEIKAEGYSEARKIAEEQGQADTWDFIGRGYFQDEYTDGVTELGYSDRHAYSIIKRTATTITVQRDIATLDPDFKPDFVLGGFVGHVRNQNDQTYTYEKDPQGHKYTLRWSEKFHYYMYKGVKFAPGRNEFYDYNF